jgi:hypothetical protein
VRFERSAQLTHVPGDGVFVAAVKRVKALGRHELLQHPHRHDQLGVWVTNAKPPYPHFYISVLGRGYPGSAERAEVRSVTGPELLISLPDVIEARWPAEQHAPECEFKLL